MDSVTLNLTLEEYNKILKSHHYTYFIRTNNSWSEDEYITNVSYQLNNFVPKQYYRQAVTSINSEIKVSHYNWKRARIWIRELVYNLYHNNSN